MWSFLQYSIVNCVNCGVTKFCGLIAWSWLCCWSFCVVSCLSWFMISCVGCVCSIIKMIFILGVKIKQNSDHVSQYLIPFWHPCVYYKSWPMGQCTTTTSILDTISHTPNLMLILLSPEHHYSMLVFMPTLYWNSRVIVPKPNFNVFNEMNFFFKVEDY